MKRKNCIRKSIFMVGAMALFAAGCKPTLLTVAQREEYEEEFGTLSKVKLSIDREIEIERVTIEKKTDLDGGKVVTRRGKNYLIIYFPEGLTGRSLETSDGEDYIEMRLDKNHPKAFLKFKNNGNDDYYHLAGKNKDGIPYVSYAGYDDFKVTEGKGVLLMKKLDDKTKVKRKRQKAKGGW